MSIQHAASQVAYRWWARSFGYTLAYLLPSENGFVASSFDHSIRFSIPTACDQGHSFCSSRISNPWRGLARQKKTLTNRLLEDCKSYTVSRRKGEKKKKGGKNGAT